MSTFTDITGTTDPTVDLLKAEVKAENAAVQPANATVAQGLEEIPAVTPPTLPKKATTTVPQAANTLPGMPQQPAQLSYRQMLEKTGTYHIPTPEEIQAQKKAEKRNRTFAAIGDAISAMSNLYFTSQGAPNAYNPQTSLSSKVGGFWDKYTKERDANSRAYLQAYMNAANMDDQRMARERQWKNTLEQQKEQAERWDKNFKAQQDERKLQHYERQQEREYRKEKDAQEREFRQRQFEEGVRQFNENKELQKANLRLSAARLQREVGKDYNTFTVGEGQEVRVPKDRLNAANIGYIYQTLDPGVRSKLESSATLKGGLTLEQQLIAIGTYIGSNPATANAMCDVAGVKRLYPNYVAPEPEPVKEPETPPVEPSRREKKRAEKAAKKAAANEIIDIEP